MRYCLLTFSSGSLLASASAARTCLVGVAHDAEFDALLRCCLKLLLLLHQVSCGLLVHASLAYCTGAELPHCFFQMIAGSLIVLPPAAELLRCLDVGAGKQHARVRSSSRLMSIRFRVAMVACTCLGSASGSFWPATASCFPGNLVWRACKQVRFVR